MNMKVTTMRKLSVSLAVLLLTIALGLPGTQVRTALAQNVGSLFGYVYDQSGVPLRGVTVTISSPTQIGGTKSTTTSDEGAFRFQGLFPGVFKISASAPKLRSVVQEGVRVGQSQTEVSLVMEVDTGQEEQITIIQKAPEINTRSSTVGESFDIDFLNSLPLATRDFQGATALAAGVTDVTGSGNPEVRGGLYFNNKYSVDGFDSTDPVTSTFGQNFSFNAMANLEVSTAGLEAEDAGTAGGVINIVTRSGSNRFEADGGAIYQDYRMRLFEDKLDRGKTRLIVGDLNVGGPILRDKLWFFVSGQAVDNSLVITQNPNFPDHPPLQIYGFDGLAKLTWRVSTRHELSLKLTASPGAFNNTLQSLLVEPEAEARQFQRTEQAILTYQYTGELFLRGLLGFQQQRFNVGPQSCEWDPDNCTNIPGEFDVLTGILRQNYISQTIDDRLKLQFTGTAEYTLDRFLGGEHGLKLTWNYVAAKNNVRSTVPGDEVLNTIGGMPFSREEYCSNDPKLSNGECRKNYLYSSIVGESSVFSLSDRFRFSGYRYLTLTPAVSMLIGSSENDRGVEVTDAVAFAPRVSAIWDATHDGRTKLFGVFRGSADTGFLALTSFTSRSLYLKDCSWDPEAMAYVRDCRSQGGNDTTTVGLPCGPTGINPDGTPCRQKLSTPRVWEGVLGAERELVTGVVLKGTMIYRKFVRQWEDAETNANWNNGGTALDRTTPFKSGRNEFIFDLQTPDEANREYRGATVELRKREGVVRALVSYTLSRFEGSTEALTGTFLDNPGQTKFYYGPLAADNRHDVRAQAVWIAKSWLSVGSSFAFLSGAPYNRLFFDPVYRRFGAFRTQRGYDNRGTLSPDDDRPLRLPDFSQLDLQLRLSLEPLIKQRIDLWVDALNVLALRTTTGVVQTDGPFWGQTQSRQAPTQLRFGAQFRF
jgi:hypothetical protein